MQLASRYEDRFGVQPTRWLMMVLGHSHPTLVSFVTHGGCLACRYDLTDKLRTQTDAGQLELWSQEDIVLDP